MLLEKQRAWVQLRNDVIQLATDATERIIGESLDNEMHRKIILRTIDKLEKELPDSREVLSYDNKSELPKEYAQNFFAKVDEKELKPLYADFRAFIKLYNENKDLREILDSPTIEIEKKQNLVKNVFLNEMQKDVVNFILSLINEKRVGLLDRIAIEADKLYHDRKCIKGIKVRTKIPLTNNEMNKLQDVLKKKFGALEVEEVVDTNMIGGLIIQLEDEVVDDSIDSRVKQLR